MLIVVAKARIDTIPIFIIALPRKRLLRPADGRKMAPWARPSRLGTRALALPEAVSNPSYKGCPQIEKYRLFGGIPYTKGWKRPREVRALLCPVCWAEPMAPSFCRLPDVTIVF